jgi:ISXO2-like transposase domain
MRAIVLPTEKDRRHPGGADQRGRPTRSRLQRQGSDLPGFGTGHQTVVHSAKEFVRGQVHSNTAEGIGSILEHARMGVWHRMSRQRLQRYLDEIGFRRNCRVKRELLKNGRRRRIISTIPPPDMLSKLLRPSIGKAGPANEQLWVLRPALYEDTSP